MSRKDIFYQHLIAFQGIDGKINDTDCRFLVTENDDSKENEFDLKNIITDKSLKQGDYITIDSIIYMVIDSQKIIDSVYIKGTFREVLKVTLESTLQDVYAIVDKVKGIYNEGQQLVEVHDQYNFIIPKSQCQYTSISTQNNLIVYSGGSYDAISIDDSKEGILIITGRFNSVYNPHTYAIKLSETTKTLVETEIYTIVASITDNGIIVENPNIIYTSSDESIATVNNGLVTAITRGNCIITATLGNASATLSLVVNAKPVEPVIGYTYAFSQSITALKTYMTTTLTTNKLVDGVADSTLKINYIFDSVGQNLINQGKVVIAVASDSSIKIKNASVSEVTTIHLTVTDRANTNIIVDTDIVLTGM
ncbi:MAG: Ig-like domain-containing protein [Clostridium beijerinckii]|jgi:hypothetical protein|nr:Ig-like domain-containing protein [Clostridium beijerinckii]MCI1578967.1 Ig-like domain-containing protein [Clostridium beijerinckii]MCI1585067.1 Ig-like domain-containing protein [Clostridium beijerinckii]MCI1624416.1 Ig-like domain-containing protein [Clostridium beijerinckii]